MSATSSDDESNNMSTEQGSSVLERELYNDMEIKMEREYMKDVEKKKKKIYKKMEAIKIKLNQLKRRSCVNYKRELKKLELVQNEKLRLLNLNRERETAQIEKEFEEDKRQSAVLNEEEWNEYISKQMQNAKEKKTG
ncbi:Hypothetical protein CINCED_3A018906 [Cinara cedri]|uniref:Uncharacterized protein n=1 Tax=Cinara cedri TaxID=506608 RepID=A0A5E4NET8_9HEMI|nr:Hypothetical protein CINCED_3A018906 [Cinara cedri]